MEQVKELIRENINRPMSKPKIQMSNTETEAEREKRTEQQVLNIKSPSMGVYKVKQINARKQVEKKRLRTNDKRIPNARTTRATSNQYQQEQ